MCYKCHSGLIHRVEKCDKRKGLNAVDESGVHLIAILTDGIIFEGTPLQVEIWDSIYRGKVAGTTSMKDEGWTWYNLIVGTKLAHQETNTITHPQLGYKGKNNQTG